MIFGEIALAEAEGALLAHGLKGEGFRFSKGRVLRRADLDQIAATGRTHVVAVRLEADDVPEDEAATEIAHRIAGENLVVSASFTGRANLYATTAGIAAYEPVHLDAINAVDESMTVALLPPNTPVVPRQMVATVKIIPFAAPRTALETVLARQAAHGPLVRVARFAPMRAVLVQTRLPGTRPSVLAHTVDVTRARLAGVGGELISDSVVEHDAVRVADALTTGIARGADLLLILGASAVVDRRDVIPSAIGAAGGVVEHFGMPVDPGNLLLLGKLGGKPVIGLPGCARSPRLNGFDWVLQRVAAGVPIGRAEIMRMGAGGLLAEIPSRPLPRRTASPAPPALRQARIASLILAAGRPRIPARANDRRRQADAVPRVVRAVETATRSQGIATIVVVGHDADRIGQALTGSEARIVHNPDFEHGLSSSLRVGLSALPAEIDGVLVQLGDMPRVTTAHLDRLIAAFDPAEGRAICIPTHRARRGNPVLWATRFVPEMLALTGDQGARGLLGLHADQICEVEMDDDGILLDGDTSANPLDGGEPSA